MRLLQLILLATMGADEEDGKPGLSHSGWTLKLAPVPNPKPLHLEQEGFPCARNSLRH